MSFVKVEHMRDEVIGIRPVYTVKGNVTEVLNRTGGVFIDGRNSESVIRALLRCYAIDLIAQHQLVKDWVQRKSVFPFYLPPKRVFLPVKMRKAIGNDSVYGYFDMDYVEGIEAGDNSELLMKLSNGLKIEIFSSLNTFIGIKDVGRNLRQVLEKDEESRKEGSEDIVELSTSLGRIVDKMARQLDRIEQGVRKDEDNQT